MKVVPVKVDEIYASATRKSKIGNRKSACEYSCFNGKQVLERVDVKV